MMRIGVAMLQGARHEHCEALQHAATEMDSMVQIVQLAKPLRWMVRSTDLFFLVVNLPP